VCLHKLCVFIYLAALHPAFLKTLQVPRTEEEQSGASTETKAEDTLAPGLFSPEVKRLLPRLHRYPAHDSRWVVQIQSWVLWSESL
jgi:hypothetical protein